MKQTKPWQNWSTRKLLSDFLKIWRFLKYSDATSTSLGDGSSQGGMIIFIQGTNN